MEREGVPLSRDEREKVLSDRWRMAERNAVDGKRTALVQLLRYFVRYPDQQTRAVPDLDFVANLLDGKLVRTKGRPPDSNLITGRKKMHAASVVKELRSSGLTFEEAVRQAGKKVNMSDSTVKQHYLECKKLGLLDQPDD